MSAAFDTALAEYQRLRSAEMALPERKTDAEEEAHRDADNAALDATTAAFEAMAEIPTTDGHQIAAKLRTLSEFYELGCCGCDRKLMSQVLAEVDAALCRGDEPACDTIPDIAFDPLISADDAKYILQEVMPNFAEQMKQVVLAACLDREQMDTFFAGLDADNQIHTLQVASDTHERAREICAIVEAVFHRLMGSAGAACDILTPVGETA